MRLINFFGYRAQYNSNSTKLLNSFDIKFLESIIINLILHLELFFTEQIQLNPDGFCLNWIGFKGKFFYFFNYGP